VQSFSLRKQKLVGGCGCRTTSVNSTFFPRLQPNPPARTSDVDPPLCIIYAVLFLHCYFPCFQSVTAQLPQNWLGKVLLRSRARQVFLRPPPLFSCSALPERSASPLALYPYVCPPERTGMTVKISLRPRQFR